MGEIRTGIGTVQKLFASRTGKKMATIQGVDYFLGENVDSSQWQEGMSVDFEYSLSGDRGQYKWINKWGVAPRGVSANSVLAKPAQAVGPSNGGMPDIPDGPYIKPEHLACVSNVLAHAIDKGASAADVHRWVEATNCALNGQEWVPF